MLTGRFTFRRTLTGKIVLQVEEDVKPLWPMSRRRPLKRRWRNATLMDLTTTELRGLMDLRMRLHSLRVEVAEAQAPPRSAEPLNNVVPLSLP
jgi:hypothetical protein